MIWARVHGQPLRQLHADAGALPWMDASESQHAILLSVGTLRESAGGEAANMTLTLRNAAGQARQLFAVPPLAARVEVLDDATVVFAGAVTAIHLDGDTATLEVEA